MISTWTIMLVVTLTACALTPLVRRWALRRAVIDRPNARSLHALPTPRGGGLAIVTAVAGGEALLIASHAIDPAWGWASLGATLVLAGIGLWDDLASRSARLRFGLQFLACGSWCASQSGFPPDLFGVATFASQVVAMVWLVNLYNFMDGSDGLATTQAIIAGIVAGVAAWTLGTPQWALVAWLIAAGSAGFLVWNWQPARIFLGDVGSYFLGGQFAVLCLSPLAGERIPWSLPIMLGPFVVDATLTLLRRVLAGERWYSPHRSHAYQLLALAGWSHREVALGLAGLLCAICVPAACVASWRPASAPWCLLLCYGILATIWVRTIRAHLGSPTA